MIKPKLNTTTLLCVDCLNAEHAIKVVERCKSLCDFADVKFLTSLKCDYEHRVEIPHIGTLVTYSIFMLKEAYKYIDTPHFLVVQRDGWIINPDKWDSSWTQYDYMGPLFNQCDVQGVGGFSFRSRALAVSVANKYPHWDWTEQSTNHIQNIVGQYEDGAIAIGLRAQLQYEGFRFPPLEVASKFAQGGNPNNRYHVSHPFGFHGTWRDVNIETGEVSRDIKHSGDIPNL